MTIFKCPNCHDEGLPDSELPCWKCGSGKRAAERESGWQEKHRWPPYTHGRILCKCGAVVATCRCSKGCEVVGTVESCETCKPVGSLQQQSALAEVSSPATPQLDIDAIIRAVAELPDRTSPDDWPDAMLVTADELRAILLTVTATPPAHFCVFCHHRWIGGTIGPAEHCGECHREFLALKAAASPATPALEQARDALQRARQFIVNGVEFGYIKMPTMSGDAALDTLPAIESALVRLADVARLPASQEENDDHTRVEGQ